MTGFLYIDKVFKKHDDYGNLRAEPGKMDALIDIIKYEICFIVLFYYAFWLWVKRNLSQTCFRRN
jgi:hypothetical protein